MAIPSVKRCGGSALIELMVAALIGVIVLGMTGSAWIAIQHTISRQAVHGLLAQNLYDVLRQMQGELRLAGYNGLNGVSATLSNGNGIVHIEPEPALLGLTYRVSDESALPYRNVVYRWDSQVAGAPQIRLCEKRSVRPLTVQQAAQSGENGVCYSLFDQKQIVVHQFKVEQITGARLGEPRLKKENPTALHRRETVQFVRIELHVSLIRQPEIIRHLSLHVLIRNRP